MSKKGIKKILICIIAIAMVVIVATKTFASESILSEINEMKQNGNNAAAKEDGNIQDIPEGEVKKEDDSKKLDDGLATSSNKSDKSDDSNNNGNSTPTAPTTTPYTGAGDYSTYIFIFIGVFAISAIYAYKKIREN